MAVRELNVANAFETTLDAQFGPTDLTATVKTTSGAPTSPCILAIDPENSSKLEYIIFDGVFTGTTFVTSVIGNRYLEGSAAGSGITHEKGAVVRGVVAKQLLEDLHDRIDNNFSLVTTGDAPGHTHTAAYATLLHASRHADGGADELAVESLPTAATDTSLALKPDGVGGVAFGAVAAATSTEPYTISLNVFMTALNNLNWDTNTAVTGAIHGFYKLSNPTPAVGDFIEWDVWLSAGTWAIELMHRTASSHGQIAVKLDGTTTGTIDAYSASDTHNVRTSVVGITVATSGVKRLQLEVTGKNASSSGYNAQINGLQLRRTA